jgi:preprotein translocase subunit SecA
MLYSSPSAPSSPTVTSEKISQRALSHSQGVAYDVTYDDRKTTIPKPKPVLKGIDRLAHQGERYWKKYIHKKNPLIKQGEQVAEQYAIWSPKKDHELREEVRALRDAFRRRKKNLSYVVQSETHFIIQALAVVGEVAYRTLKMRPYPAQMAGVLGIYQNRVIEMATGEGKTLVAGLSAVLWGWEGKPCHVVTVNDYLAKRDSESLKKLFAFCGLTVGAVTGDMDPVERKKNYHKDITYTTAKELSADFLRDRLQYHHLQHSTRRHLQSFLNGGASFEQVNKGVVTRGIHSVIVDEADSILIDEAVTPLIISRPQPNTPFVKACEAVNRLVPVLKKEVHYKVDERDKTIEWVPGWDQENAYIQACNQEQKNLPGVFQGSHRIKGLLHQALIAQEFFEEGKQFIVDQDQLTIVDELTGRLMPQRTWREGLHQFIEAKEGLPITTPSETLARISFQRFFRFFTNIGGLTGTAQEAAGEIWNMYELPISPVPLNRPSQRHVLPRRYFSSHSQKWEGVVEEVVAIHNTGRPVLVGTQNVDSSEQLAQQLQKRGLSPKVLNAVRHEEEAYVISQAGQKGSVTVATNMAGRGTDIRLGSNVDSLGGLHVIATECYESRRVERQLFGRCSRQGEKGSVRSFISLEDELFKKYLYPFVWKGMHYVITQSFLGKPWVTQSLLRVAIRWGQYKAQHQAIFKRRSVLKMDTWLDDSLSFSRSEIT